MLALVGAFGLVVPQLPVLAIVIVLDLKGISGLSVLALKIQLSISRRFLYWHSNICT